MIFDVVRLFGASVSMALKLNGVQFWHGIQCRPPPVGEMGDAVDRSRRLAQSKLRGVMVREPTTLQCTESMRDLWRGNGRALRATHSQRLSSLAPTPSNVRRQLRAQLHERRSALILLDQKLESQVILNQVDHAAFHAATKGLVRACDDEVRATRQLLRSASHATLTAPSTLQRPATATAPMTLRRPPSAPQLLRPPSAVSSLNSGWQAPPLAYTKTYASLGTWQTMRRDDTDA